VSLRLNFEEQRSAFSRGGKNFIHYSRFDPGDTLNLLNHFILDNNSEFSVKLAAMERWRSARNLLNKEENRAFDQSQQIGKIPCRLKKYYIK